jgi:AbrB family looped-hinge helix DNA binding protein
MQTCQFYSHLNGILNTMTTTIDSAGRVVIPKALRDQVGLFPGTEIEIQIRNGQLQIEPVASITVEKRGRFFVAVAPPGTPAVEPAAVDAFVNELREGRIR